MNESRLDDYLLARQLAVEAEKAGIDLIDFVKPRAPELLGIEAPALARRTPGHRYP